MLDRNYEQYGGMYVPETLVAPLLEIAEAFEKYRQDETFNADLATLLHDYAGRPTPITHLKNISEKLQRNIWLKREDLLHGGAHKTNNTLGQGLLAKYMGKKRLIAETGAGQHGVATAMIGALFNIPVEIYMGATDIKRQASNVQRMKLFGAKIHAVESGTATLKDAINEALRDWVANVEDTFYVFGTAAGPYPFPSMVAYFQRVIGDEVRQQMLDRLDCLPQAIFACIGGGSNAIGLYQAFLEDKAVDIFGAEAAGKGLESGAHAATLSLGHEGVFHGMHSKFLQNDEGQIIEPYSISAGLDYPGVGPQHVALQQQDRVQYEAITDDEALDALQLLAEKEGILPALESSHALALAFKKAKDYPVDSHLLINLSGRGDKDLANYFSARGGANE